MAIEAVIAGTSERVRIALAANIDWAKHRLTLKGAAIIGGGEADATVLARAPAWDALNFQEFGVRALVLAGPKPVPVTRAVLERAAAARMLVFVVEGGAVRPLGLDDLVGAPLGELDWVRIQQRIAGKRVLITGG
ncbi:MAG TPA: hypothetical protein PKY87_19150, partial [Terricaulis sp.]|nr:hypothetical protein [Terricaulis sp.]